MPQHSTVNRWIINPYSDSVFFIGTPLLSLCVLLFASKYFSSADIALFVLAFFAVGHHLPGLMRAYGEDELFQRYKIRFIISPIIIVLFVGWSVFNGHMGFFIFLAVWDMWHFFMQHYGFMRIYENKRHKPSVLSSRLDWWMTAIWFAYIITASPHYMINFLERCHRYGFGFYTWLEPENFGYAREVMFIAALFVSVIYILNLCIDYRRGAPIVLPKLAISLTTFSTVYFSYVVLEDVILGYAITALAHDIQYFAIVWIYNNGVLKRSKTAGKSFFRFLFQDGRLRIIGFYFFLIMAYGGIEATARATENYLVYDIVKILIATSAFLHYYYDGFIWKLRKPEIRRNLVMEGEKTEAIPSIGSRLFGWIDHIYRRNWAISCFFETGKQIVYFGIPILFLAWTDKTYSVTDIEAKRYLSEMAPSVAKTHDDLGVAYNQSGDIENSIEAHKMAILTDSAFASAYTHLGIAYSRIGKREEAIRKHRVAIEIDSNLSQAHYNLGAEYIKLGKLSLATNSFDRAVAIDSEYSLAHKALAKLYRYQGEVKIAENHDRLAKEASDTKLNNSKNLSAMPWATGTPVE